MTTLTLRSMGTKYKESHSQKWSNKLSNRDYKSSSSVKKKQHKRSISWAKLILSHSPGHIRPTGPKLFPTSRQSHFIFYVHIVTLIGASSTPKPLMEEEIGYLHLRLVQESAENGLGSLGQEFNFLPKSRIAEQRKIDGTRWCVSRAKEKGIRKDQV